MKARMFVSSVVGLFLFAATIFWPAGNLTWMAGWVYLILVSIGFLINIVYLLRVNPAVIEHRLRMGKGTKRWDIVWSIVFTPLFLSIYIVAGFDAVRFEWSSMSYWWWPLGFVLWLSGNYLFTWSMGVNPFFEKTVRIQRERGHHVIDKGPYRFVRHPGYLGFFGWGMSAPLLLGSWWALLPAMLTVMVIVVRTRLEDLTLQEELAGYREYAGRVPYRLIPKVW